MENNDAGNTVPLAAGEHEELQEVDNNTLENSGCSGGGGQHERALVVAGANGGTEGGFSEKRKRGRPRKQLTEIRQELVAESSGSPQKRGRGRPRGSGKWQTLAASLGMSAGETAGSLFTPYIIEIRAGENIVERIGTFSQMTSHSICIISASGTVSSAEIILPETRAGALRYEGDFTIVGLNGSHTYEENSRHKTPLLSVQLVNSECRFYGGAVGSYLIAAGPTRVIMSTFKQKFMPQVRGSNIGGNENGAVAVPLQEAAAPENGGRARAVDQPADWDSLQPSSNV